MRVVIVTSIFTPVTGGPATHARLLREELTRRGHAVTVVTEVGGGPSEVRCPGRGGPLLRAAFIVWWILRHRRRYDVIYATGAQEAASVGAALARRPVVAKFVTDNAWERSSRRNLTSLTFDEFATAGRVPLGPRLLRRAQVWAARRASRVIVPSDHLANAVERWHPTITVIVVLNGVVVDVPPEPPAPTSRLRVLFVGRLVPVKRVDLIIRAVAAAKGTQLTVVGDGPTANNLRALAARVVPERVVFTGELPWDRLAEHLAQADVFVSASEHEGLPHSVIEALASGTPVVCSDAGGTAEAIQDGQNGIVLIPLDVESLASTLTSLARDRAELQRLTRGAIASAPAWHFADTADRIEELLRAAIAGDGG